MSSSDAATRLWLRSWTSHLRQAALAAFLGMALSLQVHAEATDKSAELPIVHYAFSRTMFASVNESDARAAMKVYSQAIADENGITVGENGPLLASVDELASALKEGQVDVIALPAEEFFTLEPLGLVGPFLFGVSGKSYTQEYVLLTREESPIRKVEDLRGRNLSVLNDLQGSLAHIWLELLCRGQGLGPADQVLASITPSTKMTTVLLPVFFGKMDACIVTREGWEVMGEMNPQLTKQLRIVAVSEPVVPIIVSFRKGFSETLKQRIIAATEKSFSKPAFKQVLEIFKTESVCHLPVSALDSTRQFLATYHRLVSETGPM